MVLPDEVLTPWWNVFFKKKMMSQSLVEIRAFSFFIYKIKLDIVELRQHFENDASFRRYIDTRKPKDRKIQGRI
jgi:hypothetical protein